MSWLGYLIAVPVTMITFLRLVALVLPRGPAQLVSFAAFCLTALIMMLLCAAYGIVASIVLRCVGYGGLSQWTVARAFKWTMWLITGVTFDVQGSMKREGGISGEDALTMRPCVFLGNHQTELDVLMLGCMFPKYCSVTAKDSLKWAPFLGQFMALSKTVFLKRHNKASALAAFDTAANTMRTEKQSVFIFPEGTRSYYSKPDLLTFKKGAFHLAVKAQVPIVPVVVANYSHVLDLKKRRFRPGTIPVTVLPPIQTKGLEAKDVDMLLEKTRNVMLEEIVRLSHVVGVAEGKEGEALPRASGLEDQAREFRKRI